MMITKKELAGMIDHTILKADASSNDIIKVCDEALEYGFASVCVNTCFAKLVSSRLKGSDVKTCVTVGFPLGACTSATKAAEAAEAEKNGATEIDMVINISALKDGDTDRLTNDITAVRKSLQADTVLKVIIETCYLTDDEKRTACLAAKKAGADFVKTSTGFGSGGATIEDVALMKDTVGDMLKVKASGGIRSLDGALEMIYAGASRIGASSGVKIIQEYEKRTD